MSSQKFIITGIILILLAGNVVLGISHYAVKRQLKAANEFVSTALFNSKVIDFTKLFIAKVLEAEEEVGFEDRLRLENAVRDLGKDKILTRWQVFVNSKTESEAQEAVKELLKVLIENISTPQRGVTSRGEE